MAHDFAKWLVSPTGRECPELATSGRISTFSWMSVLDPEQTFRALEAGSSAAGRGKQDLDGMIGHWNSP
jgi:hypothetical protein